MATHEECQSHRTSVRGFIRILCWRPVLTTLITGLLASVALALLLPLRFFALNLSPSIEPGIYVRVYDPPEKGAVIEFHLPNSAKSTTFPCWPRLILKPVAAGPGDHVDTTGASLRINGTRIAPIQTHDSNGQPLPVWRADRKLREDEFFVFSGRVWNSLDSRYFGPVLRGDIVAVRKPLITW